MAGEYIGATWYGSPDQVSLLQRRSVSGAYAGLPGAVYSQDVSADMGYLTNDLAVNALNGESVAIDSYYGDPTPPQIIDNRIPAGPGTIPDFSAKIEQLDLFRFAMLALGVIIGVHLFRGK